MPRAKKVPEEDGVSGYHKMMPFTIEERYVSLIERAAKKVMRTKSGYVRSLVLKDLQELGFIDDEFNPVVGNSSQGTKEANELAG